MKRHLPLMGSKWTIRDAPWKKKTEARGKGNANGKLRGVTVERGCAMHFGIEGRHKYRSCVA